MSLFRISVLTLSLFTITGCSQVDNSGGEPPPGDALAFAVTAEPSGFCQGIDRATFIDDQEDIEAWVGGCEGVDTENRVQLEGALENLAEGESLVVVSAQLGGCIGAYDVSGAFLEGETLHMWMLKEDSAYGRPDAACPADLGEAHSLVVVEGASDALDIDLTVGLWNPELPGGPSAVFDDEE